MPTVTPIEWRWGGSNAATPLAYGATVVTSRLSDGSPGDTSTYEQWTYAKTFSTPCQYNGSTPYLTAIVDFGATVTFSNITGQFTEASSTPVINIVSCNPGGFPASGSMGLVSVERSSDAVTWVTLSGVFNLLALSPFPVFTTTSFTYPSPFTARYIRFLFYSSTDAIGAISGTITETVYVSDLRVYGTSNQSFITGTGFLDENMGTGSLTQAACWTQAEFPKPSGWSC